MNTFIPVLLFSFRFIQNYFNFHPKLLDTTSPFFPVSSELKIPMPGFHIYFDVTKFMQQNKNRIPQFSSGLM